MKTIELLKNPGARLIRTTNKGLALALLASCTVFVSRGQNVTEIITDYNGFFKTGISNVNSVKPDNNHNLLAFTYNGTRYSTGVNDALLTANSQTFTPADFRALPLNTINGVPDSNTKIGSGAMADGVYGGAGTAPSRSLSQYLNDGPHGLNMGTCVANLPAGTMFLSVSNVRASQIGDGIPDIIVTQTADPSSVYDRYSFTDINGNMIGNSLDIVLTNITPVGQWVADFYEATGSTILGTSFTQTQRNLRLWAADFSAFGINASNIANIAYFKINLSGDSDIAFVAYNTTTVTVQAVLAMPNQADRRTRNSGTTEEVTSLKIFPNPAVADVTFIHPKSKGGEKILVYGINGVLMMQQTAALHATQTKLSVHTLGRGSYQVVYTDGIAKYTEKLIIK